MCGGEMSEPAGDVLGTDHKGFSRKPDEWVEDGAPGDLVVVERVVEMARADGVFREDERAVVRVPD